MTGVSFTVRGVPAPQGSKRALVHRSTGRAVVMESAGPALKDWRLDVLTAARGVMAGPGVGRDRPPLEGPLLVSVAFTLPRPKSAAKSRTHPDRRPDLDKLLRALLDALTGIVFADDAQVVLVEAGKFYPDPVGPGLPFAGARVTVRPITKEDNDG
jgi:crossover junction endodeoxyribonuclease RusA